MKDNKEFFLLLIKDLKSILQKNSNPSKVSERRYCLDFEIRKPKLPGANHLFLGYSERVCA